MNKVTISIKPTMDEVNRYSLVVQDAVTYDYYEKYESLEKKEAIDLLNNLCDKYPNHYKCEFK